MTTIDRIMKIVCYIGFFVGVGGFITCWFTEDMFGALIWGVVALLNQNSLNENN